MAYNPVVWLLLTLIDLYTWVIIIAVVMSWLIAFGVVNTYNRFARAVVGFLDAVTEPVFRQVRRVIPPLGGLDISPLIVLILLQFISYTITYYSLR
jgi:YggT family protein